MSSGNTDLNPAFRESGSIEQRLTPALLTSAKRNLLVLAIQAITHWMKTGWEMPSSTRETRTGMDTALPTTWSLFTNFDAQYPWMR